MITKKLQMVFVLLAVVTIPVSTALPDSLSATAATAVSRTVLSAVPVAGPQVEIHPAGDVVIPRSGKANCDGEWHGAPAWALPDWYQGAEYYAVYQDPDETGCTDTYPFEIESVMWSLQNDTDQELQIDVRPLIYTLDLTDPH